MAKPVFNNSHGNDLTNDEQNKYRKDKTLSVIVEYIDHANQLF